MRRGRDGAEGRHRHVRAPPRLAGGRLRRQLREKVLDAAQHVRLLVAEVVAVGVERRVQEPQLVVGELDRVHVADPIAVAGGGPRPGPLRALRQCSNTCSSAMRTRSSFTSKPASVVWSQSVELPGSSSWSPWYAGPPVHWFVSTRMRTCVAFVCGTSNERMISSGARGR